MVDVVGEPARSAGAGAVARLVLSFGSSKEGIGEVGKWESRLLVARFPDFKLELPPLKTHQHTAELLPGDLATVDAEHWHRAVMGIVPFDSAVHHPVRDLQPQFTVPEVFDREAAAHFLDQSPEQYQQIFLRVAREK